MSSAFEKAFSAARAKGAKEFSFAGRRYNTKRADDPAPKSRSASKSSSDTTLKTHAVSGPEISDAPKSRVAAGPELSDAPETPKVRARVASGPLAEEGPRQSGAPDESSMRRFLDSELPKREPIPLPADTSDQEGAPDERSQRAFLQRELYDDAETTPAYRRGGVVKGKAPTSVGKAKAPARGAIPLGKPAGKTTAAMPTQAKPASKPAAKVAGGHTGAFREAFAGRPAVATHPVHTYAKARPAASGAKNRYAK